MTPAYIIYALFDMSVRLIHQGLKYHLSACPNPVPFLADNTNHSLTCLLGKPLFLTMDKSKFNIFSPNFHSLNRTHEAGAILTQFEDQLVLVLWSSLLVRSSKIICTLYSTIKKNHNLSTVYIQVL